MTDVELASQNNKNNQVTEDDIDPYQKVPVQTEEADNRVKGLDEDLDEEKILEGDADEQLRKNLMFEIKKVSLFKIMRHLCGTRETVILIIGIFASLGAGLANPLVAYLTGDTYSEVGGDAEQQQMDYETMVIMMDQIEDTMMGQVKKYLWTGFGMFFAYLIATFCWMYVGLRMVYILKERYFKVILKQEQGWFDANNAFEFATKVQAQLEQVEMGLGEQLGNIVQMIAQAIGGLVISFITSWKVTLIILCIAPFIILDMLYLVTALRKGIVLSRKEFERAGGMAEEVLYNIKTVASFTNFEFETERYNKVVDRVHGFDSLVAYRMGAAIGVLMWLMYIAMACAFIYGRYLITNHEYNSNRGREFKGGDILTTLFSTVTSVMSIGMISPMIKMVQESCIATSDYFTLLERKIPFDMSKSTYKPPKSKVQGKIEFKNVTFCYPSDPDQRVILKGIDLVFEPGKKVALVGESGCGKSTTVNLIERLYEATTGQVLIDDIDIKNYDLNYLRSLIGYVQQEPVLFNRSIEDNLIFGRENTIKEFNEGTKEELIKEACDEAFASEFINNLPDKYKYVVGIKGSKLSGGQKQRIAIARAILCKPKILILDEATSALDNKSEKEVQRALDNISGKHVTTVIIAHRLSTIKNADLIYAIKEGKVIEQGTHEELVAKKGYYEGLVRSQLGQEELEKKEENLERIKSGIKSLKHTVSAEQSIQLGAKKVFIAKDSVKINRCKLFHELKDYRCSLFLGGFGSAFMGIMDPIFGFLLAKAMNALNSPDMDIVKDDGLKYSIVLLCVSVVDGVSNFLQIWKFIFIGATLAMIFRKKVFFKYLTYHISYYDITEHAPGALLTRLSIDTMQLNAIILSLVGSLVHCATCTITGAVFGFCYDWRLTLIMLAFIPIMALDNFARVAMRHGNNKEAMDCNVEAGSVLSECAINTKTIYSFNFQEKAVEMYMDCLEYILNTFFRDSLINGAFLGLGSFSTFASSACIMYASKCYILDGSLSSNKMSIVLNTLMNTSEGVGQAVGALGNFKKAAISFRSVFSILDMQTLIDPTKAANEGKVSAANIQGKIELRNVHFAYPTRPEQKILKGVNMVVNPGESIALVGYSGCGKSTIIQLIERYYDIEDDPKDPSKNGGIFIDGVNIKDYNLYELRKKIGLVSQEPSLFKRSVMENVRYGRLEATDEEVVEAAKQACIEKFFKGDAAKLVLDNGIHADSKKKEKGKVGKKQDPVSGGEKQRLAIARAFLKNPSILLLDEATSALDRDSEIAVQKTLDILAQNRTSITIAHRLSTIEHCDRIYVLESGRIVEEGNHEELIAKKGKYYVLHKYSNA